MTTRCEYTLTGFGEYFERRRFVFPRAPSRFSGPDPPDDRHTLTKCPLFPPRAQVRLRAGQAPESAQCFAEPQWKHEPARAYVAGEEVAGPTTGKEAGRAGERCHQQEECRRYLAVNYRKHLLYVA
ncbi:hypothetical protein HPB50_009516 [Hyalomma asiaticum]|uniref:Uncharacterized protein n=1 Tax=Hyalomma asiaticum TaxID=266040 RepID=A0ACB7RNP6_HYAAI|nr:hypothetical protein HPB50_009516 [Hyalomma asiaticum]